ncbi:MAG: O-antigen ligase family protein [Oscillospiraceae bacterium]|nr:O-antigen ligase family protein [Oscillospiraceae bacterium]MBR6430416.1 O-antigen ligase family protein [Oscillospiraceae bacterium]
MRTQTKDLRTRTLWDALAVLMPLFLAFGRTIWFPALERVFFYGVFIDRLFFSALTIVLLLRRFLRRKTEARVTKHFLVFAGMMIFWIAYGAAGVALSSYSYLWEGGKDCFYLLRGLCLLYCMYEVLDTRRRTELFLTSLRLICAGLVLLGLWEIFAGWHFEISQYDPMPILTVDGRRRLAGLCFERLFFATGPFFNENNFCTFLTVFAPLFFLSADLRPGRAALRFAYLIALSFLLRVDDATICSVALLVGLLAYVILVRRNWLRKTLMAGGILLIYTRAANWMAQLLVRLKEQLSIGITGEELFSRAGVKTPYYILARIPSETEREISLASNLMQEMTTTNHSRPVRVRILITMDELDAFLESKGLGLGPDGYAAYIRANQGGHSGFVNTHNWWMEILTQYGIPVFAAYLASILWLYVSLIRAYLKNHDELYAAVVAMCTAFVVACVAPSSYIRETYQWVLPALCIVLLRQHGMPRGEETPML